MYTGDLVIKCFRSKGPRWYHTHIKITKKSLLGVMRASYVIEISFLQLNVVCWRATGVSINVVCIEDFVESRWQKIFREIYLF